MRAGLVDVPDVLKVFRAADGAEGFALDHSEKPDDGVERGAQFVAHVGEKLRLGVVREFGLLLGGPNFALRPRDPLARCENFLQLPIAVAKVAPDEQAAKPTDDDQEPGQGQERTIAEIPQDGGAFGMATCTLITPLMTSSAMKGT